MYYSIQARPKCIYRTEVDLCPTISTLAQPRRYSDSGAGGRWYQIREVSLRVVISRKAREKFLLDIEKIFMKYIMNLTLRLEVEISQHRFETEFATADPAKRRTKRRKSRECI